jgi:TetR/AcrR family transcriptional repressor of nem operon
MPAVPRRARSAPNVARTSVGSRLADAVLRTVTCSAIDGVLVVMAPLIFVSFSTDLNVDSAKLYCQVQKRYRGVMAREPRTQRGRVTRDRVLSAATGLVRERGVAAVSLDDVEAAAGVGRSQMYHYFDDRDDLLRAVAATTADAVLTRAHERLDGIDVLAGIDRWFAAAIAATEARQGAGGCPIGSLVNQLAEHDEATRLVFVDAFDRWQAPLVSGLARMQACGDLRADVSVTDLADVLMAAMQGGLLLAQVRRDPDPLRHALAGARTAVAAAMTA